MLDIKIEGVESIQSDLDEFKTKVNRGINYGLKAFASELTPCLQRHIQHDVYEAYEPTSYKRRYNNPQYGRSLFSDKNMHWNLAYRGNGEQSVEFTYEPDGRNTHYPFSRYYADGDTIIKAIQEDKGYLWLKKGSIGKKRPFWNNFVREVKERGDDWFTQGFNQGTNNELQARADGQITDTTSDYKLDNTGEIYSPKIEDTWNEEDLPF